MANCAVLSRCCKYKSTLQRIACSFMTPCASSQSSCSSAVTVSAAAGTFKFPVYFLLSTMSDGDAYRMLRFGEEVGRLKHVERKGWLMRKIPHPERVTGHMYRMAMLAMTMDPVSTCDMNKVMRMCLVHDLAETRVGDITPYDGVSAQDKHGMESEAMSSICSFLRPMARDELVQLFHEYEQHETPEAKLTKDLDLFDMILQAFEYEKKAVTEGTPIPDLEEFFTHTQRIDNTQIKSWCSKLLVERKELFAHKPQSTP